METSVLAWNGMRMRVGADWRPVKLDGDHRRGLMLMADGRQALFQVKWWRPGELGEEPREWLERRLDKETWAEGAEIGEGNGFDASAYIRREESRGTARGFWCGVSEKAGLVLEIVFNMAVSGSVRKRFARHVVPSIEACPADVYTPWRFFEVGFETPPGYVLRRHRLRLGDVSLLLGNGRGERLLVRQVFPGGLALRRRVVERWLRDDPFPQKGRGRYRVRREDRGEAKVERYETALRFPLWFVGRRDVARALVLDEELDRLLLVHAEARGALDEEFAHDLLGRMNRMAGKEVAA